MFWRNILTWVTWSSSLHQCFQLSRTTPGKQPPKWPYVSFVFSNPLEVCYVAILNCMTSDVFIVSIPSLIKSQIVPSSVHILYTEGTPFIFSCCSIYHTANAWSQKQTHNFTTWTMASNKKTSHILLILLVWSPTHSSLHSLNKSWSTSFT